jgi:hypothetical protein
MGLGFEFRETLSGSYYTLKAPGVEKPMRFSIHARTESIGKLTLNPSFDVQGELHAEGFADHKDAQGALSISMLRRKIVYEVLFKNNVGEDCRLRGERDVEFLRLAGSLTTLPISVFTGEKEVARGVLRFDLRGDLVRYLRSFRLR